MQQILLGGGAKKKTYIDDVFSTNLYRGNTTARSITNGIDLSKGGLTWIKPRSAAGNHNLFDTVRGVTKYIRTNTNAAEDNDANTLSAFNNNGFSVGNDTGINDNNVDYSSWSFKKEKGFFDVVTYTGDGASSKTISHSLGSIPGAIIIKRTDAVGSWVVYHKDLGNDQLLYLDSDDPKAENMDQFDKTDPTASSFTVEATGSGGNDVNVNSATYVAYLFAGGESTAATARSVDFDGSGDCLTLADSDDWILGNTFTIEFWLKMDSNTIGSSSNHGILSQAAASSPATGFYIVCRGAENHIQFYDYNTATIINSEVNSIYEGQWIHCALVNNGGTAKWYINGKASLYTANHNGVSYDMSTNTANKLAIGAHDEGGNSVMKGLISNLRIVKGTAVYTSSFIPPTAPLTNITNTKLLCCNGSNVTDKTVGGTITIENGDPTSSADSPFLDPAMYKFGENEDQAIIKTGSYVGNANAAGPIVELGFEPQFIFIKNSEISDNWFMFDSMRGFMGTSRTPGNARLNPDQNWDEDDQERIHITSTGFKCYSTNGDMNGDNNKMVYIAIRRPDGYCSKPIETGTSALAMDTGNNSATIPAFDSTFPVDMALHRKPGSSSQAWTLNTRLTRKCEFFTNTNGVETGGDADLIFDSNVGFAKNRNSDYQAWMFRRHKGFDVTTWRGTEVKGHAIRHNLGVKPEMIIVKQREVARDWVVLHKGLNGGSSYEDYTIKINSTGAAADQSWFNDEEPTSTHFTIDNSNEVNGFNYNYIAMLFASVPKVSAVGSYTGTGVNSSPYGPSISLDFQPRFIMIKNASNTADWGIWDSLRSLGSETSQRLLLNVDSDQYGVTWVRDVNSSGFKIYSDDHEINTNNETYIYYAHA